MSKIAVLLTLLVTALVCVLPAAPAQAQAARTFVSAAGSDSNNCANVATPCRHFAAAYAATAAEGEIDVLDPANYGELTIDHGISIQGHGWASVSAVSGGASITINGGDKINISGVILDGGGTVNSTGIQFNSGGSLTVRDSVIQNFYSDGITFAPNTSTLSQIFVSNSLVSNNASGGIDIVANGSGTTLGVIDHVQVENNSEGGIVASTNNQTINLTVTDSVIANNAEGIRGSSLGGPVSIVVRNCTIANNVGFGLGALGVGTTIRVTRSTITGNGFTLGAADPSIVLSYGDNNMDGNIADSFPPPTITYK
jgi:hypothetical protein